MRQVCYRILVHKKGVSGILKDKYGLKRILVLDENFSAAFFVSVQ